MNNLIKPTLSEKEIRSIREGIDGMKGTIPARFYYDESIYQYEVEHVLKRNWLCVGRWDQVEHPGDYFTVRMWGESIVIVRDKANELHALINVCQHRWSQVVNDGSGNANLFTCPYHNWTYNLDGSLRGMSVQPVPGVDKSTCGMHKLRIEEWQGFVFVNFDSDAKPLAPQIDAVTPLLEKYNVGTYRQSGIVQYQTTWNWKFSFETGYEGYHHAGLHRESINDIVPADANRPLKFGETCGSYEMWFADNLPPEITQPFGLPPGVSPNVDQPEQFVAIYPSLIMFVNSFQATYIIVEHDSVDSNRAATAQSFAPWAKDAPNGEELIAQWTRSMKSTQDEDTYGCSMLQKGITSKTNTRSFIHPLEQQLNHYHNWYLDHFLEA